ncbi:endosome/lysosome-associated apoptosis and autophagy regulator family member 2 isoform X2 [Tympanuchus pallidicinctus]|uniref:endosome/lysosome-associated apoptosis and autophagy regulator family member 2 isoform X2 n=1 Tax=Tympanuchus pallidicinctus TaxID=109042 RepID=UPI002286E266|nr:endosome/lysosome-associated apoptosis and autophagy regulator family member 2 isoform X2 [Tympanuchus pallidicinctus]
MKRRIWCPGTAWVCCWLLGWQAAALQLPPCEETDYHFEYTECDSSGSRWRVAVPNPSAECSGLPDPVKGKECTFSCASGEYLEMKNQVCSKCAEGTYSLGSGIKFDEWDELPAGFSNVATFMDTAVGSVENKANSCNNSSWTPRGNYIESNRDDCTVSLIYAVHLKKSGSVFFEYQYIDNNIFFEFFIQNDQCKEMESTADKWVKLTDNGEWGSHSVTLKSGSNILYWRTTGILMGSKVVKPVLVKNITIEGVAYTSECFPCKPGTYSDKPGSSGCQECPRNTYSEKGAKECTKCKEEIYYAEGSSACIERPPCTNKDFFQIHTPCDKEGKTQIMYKWIEPKICREDLPDALTLPPSGERKECPPCNPGFYSNASSSCTPCPQGTFSDGTQECKACPAGTEPALVFEYKWWNILPSNMKTSCFNVGNSKCDGMNGWEVAGDHIQSGAGGSDNDYLILNLHIPGFKPPTSVTGASGSELGRITFVFETICSADCVLYFMADINRKNTNVVESWERSKEKQSYTHVISKNASFTFTWAFQRINEGQDSRQFINDVAKIYSITVTNAVDGVASSCRACALGSEQSGSSCVPCPVGHYIEKETSQCKECPANTFLSIHQVYGREACIPCGPGSKSTKDHSACFSDCLVSYVKDNQTLSYDFSNLSQVGSLMSGPSFTSRGTKFFHFFNISLCGNEGKKMAICTDNITDVTLKDMVAESEDFSNFVGAFVCQSTIIPSDSKGFRTALALQSNSLADRFLGATVETTLENISVKTDMFPLSPSKVPDVHFFYKSSTATTSCEDGRATVVTVRCNPNKPDQGELSVPSSCPAGTCDGCTFYFVWESAEACPLCTEQDYHEIEGACKKGFQETLYVWNEPKHCIRGVPLPEKRTSTCETVDFWLKVGAGVGAFTAVLLIALTCYFWKKNQKLEYKYSKLVMTANSKECELPAADSCAIMEGEDNEEEIVYSNKQSLLGKLKSLATKEKEDHFESVQLKSSRSQNI